MNFNRTLAPTRHGSHNCPLTAGVSLFALGLATTLSAPALAQTTPPNDTDDLVQSPSQDADEAQNAATEDNIIIVTGFRESLESAQAIKRNADVVVDSITAEDIGALPDRSVTEALQRITGVTINRFAAGNDPDHFASEGANVVVRGLSYTGSRFNGREAFTAGNGAGLSFADVPSELLGGVDVFKTPSADMIEGGIGGIVNLRTRQPFDQRDDYLGASAEINYSDFANESSPTVSVLGSKRFDTGIGEFGILGSFSYSQLFTRADRLAVASFRPRATFSNGTRTDVVPFDGAEQGQSILFPRGASIGSQEFDRERYGYSAAAQWRNNAGTLEATAQFIRSDARQTWGEKVLEVAADNVASNGDSRAVAGTSINFDEDGLFESGFITAPTGWRADQQTDDIRTPILGLQSNNIRRDHREQVETNDYSINVRWTPSDVFALSFDYQHVDSDTEVRDNTLWTTTYQDAFIDLNDGDDIPTVQFQPPQNCEDPSCPAPSGTADHPSYFREGNMSFTDPYNSFWRASMDHLEISDGSSDAFQVDGELSFPESGFLNSIKAGARFQDEDQTARFSVFNWGVLSEQWGNGGPVWLTDNVDGEPGGNGGSPTAGAADAFFFNDFFRGQAGDVVSGRLYYNQNTITNQQDYENFASMIAREWQGTTTCADGRTVNAGWNPLSERCGNVEGTPFQPGEINPQSQKNYAAYALATIDSDFSNGWNFSANLGVRYTRYERESRGFQQIASNSGSIPTNEVCSENVGQGDRPGFCTFTDAERDAARAFLNGSTIEQNVEIDYDYWLPSLNARLRVSNDVQFRAGYFRGIFEPDFGFSRNFFTVGGLNADPIVDADSGLGTGEFIIQATTTAGNPRLLPIEADNFDLTAEWYFDRVGSITLSGFHKRLKNVVVADIEARQITNNDATFQAIVTTPVNSDETGTLTGFEVGYQQTYDFLPGFLSGLGLQATYTYVESSGVPQTVLNPTEPSVSAGNQPTITGDEFGLEGLSKHTVNVTPFIDIGPIAARASYNYRSRYLLTLRDVIVPFDPIFQNGYGQLDASITATINDSFKIGVQGVNLLNSITETEAAVRDADENIRFVPRQFYQTDRRFSIITRFTF